MQFIQRARAVLVGVMALVVSSACDGWTSPDENVLTLTANRYAPDSAQTFATLEMPGVAKILNEVQLNAQAQFAVRAKNGTIHVKFSRVKGAADTISRGEISFEIVKGYTYYADFSRQPANQGNLCIGCTGSLTFPMIGSESSSTDVTRLNYVHGLPLCRGCIAQRRDSAVMVARRE
ncbi:MAG: hypothetical protein ABJC26_00600 [Gemmatimonadaceae bacterium]